MKVRVIHKFKKIEETPTIAIIDACNNTPDGPWAGINPFLNGPCQLPSGHTALIMENAWQFSKVYPEHADAQGNPTQAYWDWAIAGWNNPKAVRYPMGRGRAPLYCYWKGQKLGYVESRKQIYGPLFLNAAMDTPAYKELEKLAAEKDTLYIKDWDGWDMVTHKMRSLTEVINNTKRKMGHGFFLKAALEKDPVLKLLAI